MVRLLPMAQQQLIEDIGGMVGILYAVLLFATSVNLDSPASVGSCVVQMVGVVISAIAVGFIAVLLLAMLAHGQKFIGVVMYWSYYRSQKSWRPGSAYKAAYRLVEELKLSYDLNPSYSYEFNEAMWAAERLLQRVISKKIREPEVIAPMLSEIERAVDLDCRIRPRFEKQLAALG